MMVKCYAPPEFIERMHNEIYRSGKTLETLAKEAGVTRRTLRDYSNGASMPNSLTLMRLCKALSVSADYLLFGKGMEKAHTGNKGLGKATDEEIYIQITTDKIAERREKMFKEKDAGKLKSIVPLLDALICEAGQYKEWIEQTTDANIDSEEKRK